VYGTLAGVAVDGPGGTLCQEDYLPLPSGPGRCVLAPDTPEVRANVVAKHTWSTNVVVLASGNGIRTKAWGTSAGSLHNSENWLATSGGTYKPKGCNLQVLYECDRESPAPALPRASRNPTRAQPHCSTSLALTLPLSLHAALHNVCAKTRHGPASYAASRVYSLKRPCLSSPCIRAQI